MFLRICAFRLRRAFRSILRLFLNICCSYHGTATKSGLKLNEKALLSRSFFVSLKTKFKLAIVTGRPRKVQHFLFRTTSILMNTQDCMEFLSLHSLTSLFDSVVTMDDAPLKPSPEPIHLAMQQTGGKHAVMFGDTKVRVAFLPATMLCMLLTRCA